MIIFVSLYINTLNSQKN